MRSNEGWLSNEQQTTILKQLSKGRVDSVSITYLNETGGARLYLERAGAMSGYQRLSFNITPNGSVQKMIQTAFYNNSILVRQPPDAAKNDLYDVKK
ncbi:hypothetical protein [Massilia sp. YIM B04103]|uniref:hypothetical protein n=1 Tax=Massilia sp. YIM B04103 TaxID=2963106 RepID=UPI00210BD8A6|nr:hypothetical protein [Massilia sp. YIM B04103]